MKKRLSAVGVVAGAAALLASSLLGATPAQAAGTGGNLVINIVDQYGHPTTGLFEVLDSTGAYETASSATPYSSTQTYSGLPAGGYEIGTLTGWSGVTCAGLTPCDLMSQPSTFVPVVTVSDSNTTTYTMKVTVPSVVGANKPGSTLQVKLPPAFTLLQNMAATQAPGSPGTQWLRSASSIAGATTPSYKTALGDVGKKISAQLTPSAGMTALFSSLFGGNVVPPLTTNAITVQKAQTTTAVSFPKRISTKQRATVTVKVRSASGTPKGYVTITVGKFKVNKYLQGGTALVTLPRMTAGTHRITTRYAGNADYAASTGNTVTFTAHR